MVERHDTRRKIAEVILQSRIQGGSEWLQKQVQARRCPQDWQQQKLVIVAADHAARRVTAVHHEPFAMADRADLLLRIANVLMQPQIDGLLATPDIMDELFWLNAWVVAEGGPDFLSEKVLVGSMNRAGLAGTSFELDDFVTAYTAEEISRTKLDAGKLLLRLQLDSRDSGHTLRYVVDALNDLADAGLPQFLEPLMVPSNLDDLVKLVGVASALGKSSANRWLKLPIVDEFHRVAQATTCPILLLGGANPGAPDAFAKNIERCMEAGLRAGDNVRGIMAGRGVLYPEDGTSPVQAALQLAAIVRGENVALANFPSPVVWDGLQ